MTSDISSGPLRILHIIDGLGIGGAEMQLTLLLRHLPRHRFSHVVCHVGPPTDLAATIAGLGVPVHDLSRASRRSLTHALVGLLGHVHRNRPDIIHTDGVYSNLCGRLAGAVARIPVLTTVGSAVTLSRMTRLNFNRQFLRRRVLLRAELLTGRVLGCGFMAVSAVVRASVIARYGVSPDRVTVVHRGVDLEEMAPGSPDATRRLRRMLAPPDAWPLLLSVGRLVRAKGQEYLIRALPAIRESYPAVCLLLVGEGPLENHYRSTARECGVSNAVRFLGRRMDIASLLPCADIFVFPSTREGAAGALLEAMALARPIVASRIPAIEEVLGDAALLVPPRSADHLARVINQLAGHPEVWPTMGTRARRIVEDLYDIRRNAETFGQLCERMARGHTRSALP